MDYTFVVSGTFFFNLGGHWGAVILLLSMGQLAATLIIVTGITKTHKHMHDWKSPPSLRVSHREFMKTSVQCFIKADSCGHLGITAMATIFALSHSVTQSSSSGDKQRNKKQKYTKKRPVMCGVFIFLKLHFHTLEGLIYVFQDMFNLFYTLKQAKYTV